MLHASNQHDISHGVAGVDVSPETILQTEYKSLADHAAAAEKQAAREGGDQGPVTSVTAPMEVDGAAEEAGAMLPRSWLLLQGSRVQGFGFWISCTCPSPDLGGFATYTKRAGHLCNSSF